MYKPQNFLMMLKAWGVKVIIIIGDRKVPPPGKKLEEFEYLHTPPLLLFF